MEQATILDKKLIEHKSFLSSLESEDFMFIALGFTIALVLMKLGLF